MSRIKNYFMERLETVPEFRQALELEELRNPEPVFPDNSTRLEYDELQGVEGRQLKAA